MKIDKALNLVIPVETDDGVLYVHAAPLSREAFERYFLLISKTFAAIYEEGLHSIAGPRVAALMMRQLAEASGMAEDVRNGLFNEIRRLANVALLTAEGWQTLPLETALTRELISADDFAEIEGQLVFFICVCAMHRKNLARVMMQTAAQLWESQLSSLSCTEFASSLPTSIATASSGATAPASSIPL